jgi:hypothetical protein
VPDQGQELARTHSTAPARFRGGSDLAGQVGWQDILDQLEGDVSRAEQLAVGTRMVSGRDPLAESSDEVLCEAMAEDPLSDETLARLSIPLPDEQKWEPPRGHAPMPAMYAERARALLDRQIAIAAHIAREITMGRQQAAYAHHIEELEEVQAPPAFIDEVT